MAASGEVRRLANVSTPHREVLYSAKRLRERVRALAELDLAFEVHALWVETVFVDGDVWREPCWEVLWATEAGAR